MRSDLYDEAAGGDHYAALCTLSLRQAFGGTELVGTVDKPWLMLYEIAKQWADYLVPNTLDPENQKSNR
ncbi:MAG TPA: DUF4965 domain-containing protein [Polyangiaceae bacterium]